MTELKERFAFSDKKILICIHDNIQKLYLKISEYIDKYYPLLFLTGSEGIGRSTALFAVQSYLRLNDKLRIVYIHDVEELICSSAKLKNEIFFTFHLDYIFNDEIEKIESKESQKAWRILDEIRDIFELVISHCRKHEKKLIVIKDIVI
jgi:chromosomal replication initiation ATPase DnaA